MKKILSIMLISVMSLLVLGTTDILKAEATTDVTIYLHIHQYDGDYTNSGTGIWDGVTWNNFGDTVGGNTDDFGGIVTKTYTAAEINAVSDEIEFKPTRDVNNDDNTLDGGLAANSNYLAPDSIEGKVMADVTKLKDGSETELHLYYVEGAKDFYEVYGTPANGLFFNVYANPEVAANEAVYDGWGMHTWNAGTGDAPTWEEPLPYNIDVELQLNGFVVPMKLGVINVGDDAVGNVGFIVHNGDTKSCGSDMFFSANDLLALNGMAEVQLYEHGACEFDADYATFAQSVGDQFEVNSGNRLVEGTQIAHPNQLDVTMLMPKMPLDLLADRFMVKDAEGNEVAISSVAYPILSLGDYVSDVTVQTQSHVILRVDTTYAHADLGLVGSMQGWNPANAIASLGDDSNGYAVFEFTTFDSSVQFKVLYNDPAQVDDPATTDVDESGFNWGDAELIGDNGDFDLSAGGTFNLFLDDAADVYTVVAQPIAADTADYTYTAGAACTAGNKLTLFVNTQYAAADLGIVGSFNEWNVGNAVAPVGTTASGLVVFEFCSENATDEYKVLYNDGVDDPATTDADESGFDWGDTQLTPDNVKVDLSAGDAAQLIWTPIQVIGDYTATLEAVSNYRLSIYVTGPADLDWTKLGIVGSMNGWDISNPILATKTDVFGNHIFDLMVTSKTPEYKIVYDTGDNPDTTDVDESGFGWDDVISGNDNITVDLGAESTWVTNVAIDSDMVTTFTEVGKDYMDLTTTMVSLMFPDDTFMWDDEFTVSYYDGNVVPMTVNPADTTSDVYFSEYIEGTSNNKALELYNPTNADIDLTGYMVKIYSNGATDATKTLDLTGKTIAAGGTLTICTDTYANQDDCDIVQAYADADAVVFYNGNDALELVKDSTVIDVIGIVGDDPADGYWVVGDGETKEYTLRRNADIVMGNTTFTADEWMVFPQNTFDGLGNRLDVENWLMSDVLPYNTTNEFVAGDPVAQTGTYAEYRSIIAVDLMNASTPLSDIMLKDSDGNEIPVAVKKTAHGLGDYTPVGTCETGNTMIYIHLHLIDTVVTDLAELGIVGTINGWDVTNSITASGIDSAGNYVFEVCIADDTTNGEFKIKLDPDLDGFTWDSGTDPELTPNNVAFNVKFILGDGPDYYVEEGQSQVGVSLNNIFTLAYENRLDVTKEYHLEFVDENGFTVYTPVIMDTEAPQIDFTVVPGATFTYDNATTFDLMNYYTKLQFLDNRDGELAYTIVTPIDPTVIGQQTVTISATDEWNNTGTYDITITVVDTTDPVITGDNTVTFTAGDDAPDWTTYVTVDGGTLSVDASQVDMATAGTYTVVYTATDEAGNTATHNLVVTVDALPKTGCGSAINIGGSIVVVIAALGGAVLYFSRKQH